MNSSLILLGVVVVLAVAALLKASRDNRAEEYRERDYFRRLE